MKTMEDKIEVAEMKYGREESMALRENIIQLRDSALSGGRMEWAVQLSHAIAWMQYFIDREWPRSTPERAIYAVGGSDESGIIMGLYGPTNDLGDCMSYQPDGDLRGEPIFLFQLNERPPHRIMYTWDWEAGDWRSGQRAPA